MKCMWVVRLTVAELFYFTLLFLYKSVCGNEEYLALDDNLYFEVVEPESLRYSFRIRVARQFGKPFSRQLSNIALVPCDPFHCCNSPMNPIELRNNVALIERGGCSFLTKCIKAQNAGALAVIVADNDPNNDSYFIDMMGDNTKRNCSVPAAFMLGKDASMIRRSVLQHGLERVIINIPVNMSLSMEKHRPPPWVMP